MSGSKQRYVILHHVMASGEHWDLMLETGPKLATWQLSSPPPPRADRPIEARRIADHRAAYLEYEGPVSGERGHVRRVDGGRFRLLMESEHEWVADLEGSVCRGTYRLVRAGGQSSDLWFFQVQSSRPDESGSA
jgi:hypothetical protein